MSNFDSFVPPKKFVGLHGHSSFSTFDGLGYPKEHIDFVLSEEQGMDAWALTDHGNGSGLAHAHSHAVKMQKAGRDYRQVYGVEFYFVPSLSEWQLQIDAHRQSVKDAKASKSKVKSSEDAADLDSGGHTIEDEDETRGRSTEKPEWKKYHHLIVLAKNRVGLGNLFTLVKRSYKEGFYRFPRIDYKMLKEHSEGLIISTACVGGRPSAIIYEEFPGVKFMDLNPSLLTGPKAEHHVKNIQSRLVNMVDQFVDCVGEDNFFLEMQFHDLPAQHLTNMCLLELSNSTGIDLIATPDSHFPSPDKWQARELYKKLGWMGSKAGTQSLPKQEEMKTMLYPKNADQMWAEFKKGYDLYDFYQKDRDIDTTVREAIERTHEIAWDMCEDTWIDTSAKLPTFGTKDTTAFKMLLELVKKAFAESGLSDKPEYVARVKEELSDIKFLGHESYFLAMNEIFHLASKKTLFGPGRGSGSGSLVNYLLGITQIDPIPHGLLWSRFLGRHRVSWPDIDTDAGDRDALIDASRELYGDDAVIPVSNFNTLKLKSLVKDIAKFYGVPFEDVNKMTGPLQDEVMPHAKDENQEKSVFVLTHDDCMKFSPSYREFMENYPEVEKHVSTLFMENRSIGRHAGGVIIGPPKDLERSMPIIGVRGELQTPWTEGMNFRNLEDNGFLKFDFLGLTLLKDVENCIYRILKKQGNPNPTFAEAQVFFDEHLNCRYAQQDDPEVWKHVYHNARFTGVFQFTNAGSRNFCLDAQPTSIEELAALTAIYRPGPLKANVHRKYVEAKRNAADIKYDHPVIESVLGPTFNFVVFQEQFMTLAVELAGFTPGESDKLRKTLVKKSLDTIGAKGDEKSAARKKFIQGAKDLHGISESITSKLWDTIEAFSVYGFNKSHAVAYAIDSYYAAWLHTHYEKEWLATVLQSENSTPAGLLKAIAEIKSYGYEFAQIDINYSGLQWEFSDKIGAFVPPLSAVKGIGDAAMDEIMRFRPYSSLLDMFYDEDGAWKHSKMNKSCLTSLCKIEALESLEDFSSGAVLNHRQLLEALLSSNNHSLLRKGVYGMSKTQLKKARKAGEDIVPFLGFILKEKIDTEDWTRVEKIDMSYDLTSTVEASLLFPQHLMDRLHSKDLVSIHEIQPGSKGVGWLCITDVIKKKTKNGKTFYRLRANDDNHQIAWLRVWGSFKHEPEKYTLWLAHASNDVNWGLSTNVGKMRRIT